MFACCLLAACHDKQESNGKEPGTYRMPHTEPNFDSTAFTSYDSAMPWPDPKGKKYKPEDTIEPFVRRCCHMRDHPNGWYAPHRTFAGGQKVYLLYIDVEVVTRLDSMPYYDKLYSPYRNHQ